MSAAGLLVLVVILVILVILVFLFVRLLICPRRGDGLRQRRFFHRRRQILFDLPRLGKLLEILQTKTHEELRCRAVEERWSDDRLLARRRGLSPRRGGRRKRGEPRARDGSCPDSFRADVPVESPWRLAQSPSFQSWGEFTVHSRQSTVARQWACRLLTHRYVSRTCSFEKATCVRIT